MTVLERAFVSIAAVLCGFSVSARYVLPGPVPLLMLVVGLTCFVVAMRGALRNRRRTGRRP